MATESKSENSASNAFLEPARLIDTNIGDFAYFQELLSGPFVTRRIFLVNYVKYGGIA